MAGGIEVGEPRLSMTIGGIDRSGKAAKKGVVDLARVVDMMGWCGYVLGSETQNAADMRK